MKKWIKYLAVPAMALALAFVFSFKTESAKAYIVNYGDCTSMDFGTIQCGGGENVTYEGYKKLIVSAEEVEALVTQNSNYSYEGLLYNSNSKGEMQENKKYFVKTNTFVTKQEYYQVIADLVNADGNLYKENSSSLTIASLKIAAIGAKVDDISKYNNKLVCDENYFYSSEARRCVHTDDIAVPDQYVITDYSKKAMDVWSEGNYKFTHDHTQRDVILFNLPANVEWAVKSINSITVTYSTCSNKTDGKCDEASEKKTVTYYDNGTITITRYDSKKKIDVISNMGLTKELAAVEESHPNALDSSNKYNRLFHSATASNIAEAYKHYLVLNVDDTMYVEMIEVDCTLINGKKSVGNTEGSVVADNSTEVTTLALVTKCLMYLGYALLAIGLIIVAKLILKPVGDVISDSSAVRKEKSIAKAKNSYKKGNRKR